MDKFFAGFGLGTVTATAVWFAYSLLGKKLEEAWDDINSEPKI